jgi:hypothetical protein
MPDAYGGLVGSFIAKARKGENAKFAAVGQAGNDWEVRAGGRTMGGRKMGEKYFLGRGPRIARMGANNRTWFPKAMEVYAKASCAFGTPIAKLSGAPAN